jgi:hypothetical protein
MSLIAGIAREIYGLFVDDGAFALAILVAVALAALVAGVLRESSWLAGLLLLASCLGLLFGSAARAASRG